MKLSDTEKKWIAELQTVLNACPTERLGFYTVGDPIVFLYDRRKEGEINKLMGDHCGWDYGQCVDKAGAEVGEVITFPHNVHSVAG